jgi:hypothetical protein
MILLPQPPEQQGLQACATTPHITDFVEKSIMESETIAASLTWLKFAANARKVKDILTSRLPSPELPPLSL